MRADGIIQLVTMLGTEKIVQRKTYIQISCPLAKWTHRSGADRHPSLNIMIRDNDRSGFKCHACLKSGTLNSLVIDWSLHTGTNADPMFDLIKREEESVEAVHGRMDRRTDNKWANLELFEKSDYAVFSEEEIKPFVGRVPQYILDRGIKIETCREWELGIDEDWKDVDSGKKWTRAVFPVRRRDGKLVGLVGRAVDEGCPHRYINYWHFPKHYIYGLNKLKDRHALIVVEGMIDTLKFWEYGLPVGGTMGAELSEEQAQLMLNFERVYLALDRDKAGEEGTRWLIKRLQNRVPLFRLEFPDGKTDPKQLTQEEAWQSWDQAKRVL